MMQVRPVAGKAYEEARPRAGASLRPASPSLKVQESFVDKRREAERGEQ